MPWVSKINKPIKPLGHSDDKIRFIWLSDNHVGNSDTDSQVVALEKAVSDCNDWKPNAFIVNGDVCGNTVYQLARWFNHTWRCQRPVYLAIGNHDLSEHAPGSYGNPADISGSNLMDRPSPFNQSFMLTSGDGTVAALCIIMDSGYYDDDPDDPPPGDSIYHNPGDRIGASDITPSGGYYRQFTAAQLSWVASTLAADTTSDYILVFSHYQPRDGVRVTDYTALADVLQGDSRPIIGFCGHDHGDAKVATLTTMDTLDTYNFYKIPAMLESGAWCRVELDWNGAAISIDLMELQNYTDPGGWTINAPFTVAS